MIGWLSKPDCGGRSKYQHPVATMAQDFSRIRTPAFFFSARIVTLGMALVGFVPSDGVGAEPAEQLVRTVAEFDAALKQSGPGDTIVLAEGDWRDAKLVVRGSGKINQPLTIRAQTPGKVRVTGRSGLRIGGSYVVVSGLWFDDCEPEGGELISFRTDSKHLASHSTLRHTAVTQSNTAGKAGPPAKESKWVSVYGVENVVEYCEFVGKTSGGTLLVVWLPDVKNAADAPVVGHRIERNYFGPRPRLGRNGGEIIRVGDSAHAEQTAGCLIAQNRFEKCDGEAECISNKSCGNTYRGNTFVACQGTLTLRHGHACRVEGNVFLGEERKETGGIRVIGERHRIVGNYLVGVTGDDARAALCLMNGQTNAPANGYAPVRDCLVADNTVLQCRHSIVIGYADEDVSAPVPPTGCRFEGNYVVNEGGTVIDWRERQAEVVWQGNVMWGTPPAGIETPGIVWNSIRMKRMVPPTIERSDVGPDWRRPTVPGNTLRRGKLSCNHSSSSASC